MSTGSDVTTSFGVFELDRRSGELRKAGVRVKLAAQPFQLLVALLDRAGEVVTREELQRQVWPADTFVDFDRGLNKAVNRLREALGDTADSPRFIETVPKRGYRFIAPLQNGGAGSRSLPEPARADARQPRRRRQIGIAAAALLVLGAAAAYAWISARTRVPHVPSRIVLAGRISADAAMRATATAREQRQSLAAAVTSLGLITSRDWAAAVATHYDFEMVDAEGMPRDEAYRMSVTIDWRSTLVVPVPSQAGSYRPINVAGNEGLLIEGQETEEGVPPRLLMWSAGGRTFAVGAPLNGPNGVELLEIAQTLQ